MRTKTYTVSIHGEKWKYRILSEKSYIKTHGEESLAITFPDRKLIDFRPEGVTVSTVRHELIHAYIHYLFLQSSTLDKSELEEIFCEMAGYYWETIDSQTSHMYIKMAAALEGLKV